MKRSVLLVLASFLAITVGSTAQAASMTAEFDLRGAGHSVASLNLSQGGLGLTISPDTISNYGVLNGESDILLTRENKGIGVDNRNCVWIFCGDSGQLDGFGYNDIALFQFSKNVTIESFTLLNSDRNDHLSLFGGDGFGHLGRFHIPGTNVVEFASLSAEILTGNLFGIAAFDYNDNFRIAGLTVSYDAVPIPAALPLMLTGLAGMGLWSRRKKRLAALAA